MNRQDQHEDFPEKPSAGTHGRSHQKRYIRSHGSEDWQVPADISDGRDESRPYSRTKEEDQPPLDQESFAYQLLLLQQRLVAYEQLHLEEIAELRQEIEQLRRAFLQETHPQLREIAPARSQE